MAEVRASVEEIGDPDYGRMSSNRSSAAVPGKNRNGEDILFTCCGLKVTKKVRTLLISFTLFLTIATAQLVGALIANSLALLSDTASMFLDAATYAVNIYAETQDKADIIQTQKRMLIASGISFAALLGITLYFLVSAASEIAAQEEASDDVNAEIVLAFALVGVLFDVLSLIPYMKEGVAHGAEDDHAGKMNMCSALSHIISDTLRSLTTLVESLVIMVGNKNAGRTDAYSAVVVSSLIILGLMHSLYEWFGDVIKFMKGDKIDDSTGNMRNVVADSKDKMGEQSREPSQMEPVEDIGGVDSVSEKV